MNEWLEWRKHGITATEVADAANGTYGGAYGVVARKLGLIEVEQTAVMERGHRWQPKIADAITALTGVYVVGEETWCEHSDTRWRATVDGFVAPVPEATPDELSGVIEIKTYGRNVKPNRQRWADQIQWQMFVTGLDKALLVAAKIDDDTDQILSMWFVEYDADPMRQIFLETTAEELWKHVQDGTLPEPDSADALPLVKEIHSTTDGSEVDLSDIEADVARFVEICTALKAVEDEKDLLEAKIRDSIGQARKGVAGRFKVSVSNPRNVLTAEAEALFVAEHPEYRAMKLDRTAAKKADRDLYDSYCSAVGARILTIKEMDDE